MYLTLKNRYVKVFPQTLFFLCFPKLGQIWIELPLYSLTINLLLYQQHEILELLRLVRHGCSIMKRKGFWDEIPLSELEELERAFTCVFIFCFDVLITKFSSYFQPNTAQKKFFQCFLYKFFKRRIPYKLQLSYQHIYIVGALIKTRSYLE